MATTVSPANGPARATERSRIPMSVPRQKLSVDDIPGYHLHWMKGTPDRLEQALQAGYEFVQRSETLLANHAIGGDSKEDGGTDLGSRVSVSAGEEFDGEGQPVRLYLMKIKEEWHQEDLKAQEQRSESVRNAMLQGQLGREQDTGAGDNAARYVGSQTNRNMFQPRTIRRS